MGEHVSERFTRFQPETAAEQSGDSHVIGLDGWDTPTHLLLDALQPILYPRDSAWLGHIPFLYSLIGLQRPRRFVELGTHNGASFFAACQTVRDNKIDCQCIAVDHWIGDKQAGIFTEQVFERFHATLTEEFADVATFIRADFAEAALEFEDGSIDLLHIDGFHSYDAVRSDFENFRAKLSDRAVVIFHDVNEYQSSFGAWRFWGEIVDQHPGRTISFGHWHGLGVLSLDVDPASPVNRLIDRCADRDFMDFLQQYYVSVYAAQTRADLRVRAAETAQRRLVTTAESRAAEAARQAAKVRSSYEASTSWRVTRPLRALSARAKRARA